MKQLLLLVCLFCATAAMAQSSREKGLQTINRQTAEAHIGFLASDLLEGREAGTQSGQIAGTYIASCLQAMGIAPLGSSYYHPFEVFQKERSKRSRWEFAVDSLRLQPEEPYRKLSLHNVLGMIEGRNKDEIVIVGAHYDHLGVDPFLQGDPIYNGADDNASGVSAVLQIARAFLATGQQPERTVIFAFWDGEEKGLLGSRYFVSHYTAITKVKAYLNFDMIGRNNQPSVPSQVVYFYSNDYPQFGDWLRSDIKEFGLDLTPTYRPSGSDMGGSDNVSFLQVGIPIIWYHTDGHPDYHLPSDHAEKINWQKVVEITKASFLNMWKLANEKDIKK